MHYSLSLEGSTSVTGHAGFRNITKVLEISGIKWPVLSRICKWNADLNVLIVLIILFLK